MNTEILKKTLREAFGKSGLLYENEPMSRHTSFCIGGPADFYLTAQSEEDIVNAARAALAADAPYYIIGGGSNILVADAGLRGLVIKLGDTFSAITIDYDHASMWLQAGASNKAAAAQAADAGLSGYEFASGIPGSIGGAAYMNAGAYGAEFKDVCTQLTCFDENLERRTIDAKAAQWSYRSSLMAQRGWIITSAALQLKKDSRAAITQRIAELHNRRASKQPLKSRCAGSIFKRPKGYYTGPLIQKAGMQGRGVGGAQVSNKHAGFIINTGTATAQDVLDTIHMVQEAVYAMCGVWLECEVRLLGFDSSYD